MGQKKIKMVDLSQPEEIKDKNKIKKPKKEVKKEVVKSGKDHGNVSDMGAKALAESEKRKEIEKKEEKELVETAEKKAKEEVKAKKAKPKKVHSRRYRQLKTLIDRKKLYPFNKAIELLLKVANSKIDETVELHISTREDKLTGSVKLPHGTGKKQKIAIADKKLIDQVSKGKIDFDILIANPAIMPQLAKVAKVLGPKGLMPSPKTNTIGDNPEALKKNLETGETNFRTENKFPLIHLVIGKVSFGEKKLLENLEAVIKAVKPSNIKKAALTSTHSPGIKLEIK